LLQLKVHQSTSRRSLLVSVTLRNSESKKMSHLNEAVVAIAPTVARSREDLMIVAIKGEEINIAKVDADQSLDQALARPTTATGLAATVGIIATASGIETIAVSATAIVTASVAATARLRLRAGRIVTTAIAATKKLPIAVVATSKALPRSPRFMSAVGVALVHPR